MNWAKAELEVKGKGSTIVALRRFCYIAVMTTTNLFFLMALAIIPFQTKAEGATNQLSYVMCRDKKVVRTIRVTSSGEQCTTVYTKSGVDKIVSAGKSKQGCMDVMQNIKGNLEGAQWKCKDISQASVTESASPAPNGN